MPAHARRRLEATTTVEALTMIDLRSDTVTRPTPGMREAMAQCEVGDDVIDVDPTIDRLEKQTAQLLGKERALFVPSGTMSNQIAVRLHCRPGDEFLCEAGCHIYNYEQAGFAQLSGVVARPLQGDGGMLDLHQLTLHPDDEHFAPTRLITLENTHNRSGGRIQDYDNVVRTCSWAREHGLATHLDGARLMNAVVASGVPAKDWAQHFDTVSICFSKGLGAPVGSALAGTEEAMRTARRHRKLFGGGMRQAGVIAAGALYALEQHVDRLAEDHAKAKQIADAIEAASGLELTHGAPHTNIVLFHVLESTNKTADEVVQYLADHDIHVFAVGPQSIRAVTHLDVSKEQIETACDVLREI